MQRLMNTLKCYCARHTLLTQERGNTLRGCQSETFSSCINVPQQKLFLHAKAGKFMSYIMIDSAFLYMPSEAKTEGS